jgi:dTDP-4-amino-4,6-dideoxygalactose transaminase
MIPFALPLAQYQKRHAEIITAVTRVFDSGTYVLGPEVAVFEKAFATYCGVVHGVGVNSGTDALLLALKALDVGRGDEVITVSHTAIATVSAVLAVGATPVLVDIDPEFYCLDPGSVATAITSRTKAIIAVHLYGQSADMDAVLAVAKSHGVAVIEDCAQATGGLYKGKHIGSLGDVGCFSFYPTKNLGAIGDGGMVVTDDALVAERVRRLRQYGWNAQHATDEPGVNSRLDEVQAAILNVKLPTLDADNAMRIKIAQRYNAAFTDLPVTLPAARPDTSHVYHLYVLGCDERDGLKKHLADRGILAGIHYPVPAHRHGGYESRVLIPEKGLPITDGLVNRILTLPLYPELTSSQIEQVIGAVRSYYV